MLICSGFPGFWPNYGMSLWPSNAARQKYTRFPRKTMDATPLERMKTLLGLNPDVIPPGLQFPRLPPGPMHPMTSQFAVPKGKTAHDATSLTPNLEDFQQAYQKHAAGLLSSHYPGIVPPGHPLYEKQTSVSILKSENDKLSKENLELKRQLDEMAKSGPRQLG